MRFFIFLLSLGAFLRLDAQSTNELELIEILNTALNDSKLPGELINQTHPNLAPWDPDPFIVVKSDKNKEIERQYVAPGNSSNVWVFDYEDIFLYDIGYSMNLTKIERQKGQIILYYETKKYPKKDASLKCHRGKIVAERIDKSWTILSSTFDETKCEIDFYGHKK